jgi:DnaJ-class molecular chaperone
MEPRLLLWNHDYYYRTATWLFSVQVAQESEVRVQVMVCPDCDGDEAVECPECEGRGYTDDVLTPLDSDDDSSREDWDVETCDRCDGEGTIPCPVCQSDRDD